MSGGLAPARLTLIAAPPHAGGSLLAAQAARHAALVHRLPVLYAASGLSRTDVAMRMIAAECGADYRRLRTNTMTGPEQDVVRSAQERLAGAQLHIDDGSGLSAEAVAEVAADIGGVGLVVVDRLQHAPDPAVPLSGAALPAAARVLARLARTLGVSVVAAVDSVDAELLVALDADVTLTVTREGERAEVTYAERDFGALATVGLVADLRSARFTDLPTAVTVASASAPAVPVGPASVPTETVPAAVSALTGPGQPSAAAAPIGPGLGPSGPSAGLPVSEPAGVAVVEAELLEAALPFSSGAVQGLSARLNGALGALRQAAADDDTEALDGLRRTVADLVPRSAVPVDTAEGVRLQRALSAFVAALRATDRPAPAHAPAPSSGASQAPSAASGGPAPAMVPEAAEPAPPTAPAAEPVPATPIEPAAASVERAVPVSVPATGAVEPAAPSVPPVPAAASADPTTSAVPVSTPTPAAQTAVEGAQEGPVPDPVAPVPSGLPRRTPSYAAEALVEVITGNVDAALRAHRGDIDAARTALIKKAIPDVMDLFRMSRVGGRYEHRDFPPSHEILRKKTQKGADQIWEARPKWRNKTFLTSLSGPVEITALDMNAAYLAAMKTWLPIGQLEEDTTGIYNPKKAGVHLIAPLTWDHPHLPNPLGDRREPGDVWISDATLRLLFDCADWDLCEPPVIRRALVSGATEGLLEKLRRALTEARKTAIADNDKVTEDYVKSMYSKFVSTIGESSSNRDMRRPDWMHIIRAKAFSNLWRKAYRAHESGLTVVEISGTDELHLAGDWRTSTTPKGKPAFPEGRNLDQVKEKHTYTLGGNQ